jgi:hypothetical protein
MAAARMTHLLPDDAALFQEYLDAHPDLYTHIEYDVRVGLGRDPGPDFPSDIRNMAVHLSQRRIDAVGFRPGRIDIIEVTLRAGIKALGQLIAYVDLYQSSFFPTVPLYPILVTRAFSSDAEHIFRTRQIQTFLYPPS